MKIKFFILFFVCITVFKSFSNTTDSISFFNFIDLKINDAKDSDEYNKSMKLFEKVDSIIKESEFQNLLNYSDFSKLQVYKKFNKYAKALSLSISLDEKLIIKEKLLNCDQKIYLYKYLHSYMKDLKQYKKAIFYLNKIEKLSCFKITSYGHIYYHKAFLYSLNKDIYNANKTMENRINVLKEKKDTSNLISTYNQYGLINTYNKENKKAIEHFNNTLELIKLSGKRKGLKATISGNIGLIYNKEKKYIKAKRYLEIDSKGSLKNQQFGSFINAEIELSLIDYQHKKYKKAIKRLENLKNNYQKYSTILNKITILYELSRNYKYTKNAEKAYDLLTKYSSINDSLNNIRNEKNQILLNSYSKTIYKKVVERLEQKNILTEKDLAITKKTKEIDNQRNKFLIFVLSLFIIAIFFIFKRMNDTKVKKTIMMQNKLELKEKSLKLEMAEKKILELKIIDDNKKINSLALELNLKQDFSDKLIKKLESNGKLSKPELMNIEIFVQNELDLKSSRAKLQKDINSLGNIFFNSLKKAHPNLTDNDLKLCSMVVLNLPNKEIAISRNIETNSVKISKNRLKKKLNLLANNDLTEYLSKFLENY